MMSVSVAHVRMGLALGLASCTLAVLETIARRSDRPRHIPVGNGLLGNGS
jgi:hypothetical protein